MGIGAVNRLSYGMLIGSLLIGCGYVLGSWLRMEEPERKGRDVSR